MAGVNPEDLLKKAEALIPTEDDIRPLVEGSEGGDGTAVYIWPIAKGFVRILNEVLPPRPSTILDIGCGRGLLGVAAALLRPNAQVILSDGDRALCECLKHWDWGPLSPQIKVINHHWDGTWPHPTVDVIIGSDLTYRHHWLTDLFTTMAAALTPSGTIHLVEKWRNPQGELASALQEASLSMGVDDQGAFRLLSLAAR